MTIVELRTMNEKTVDTLAGEKWSVEAETLWTRLGEDDEDDVSDGDDDNNADYNDDGNYQPWGGWCCWWIYLIQHKPIWDKNDLALRFLQLRLVESGLRRG